MRVQSVLFASVRNAGRSQIATAWFNMLAHPEKASAASAGTEPADALFPAVVEAMKGVGLDLASNRPRLLTPSMAAGADLIISMPPLDETSVTSTGERDSWLVGDDCSWGTPERVGEICRELERLVRKLLVARHWLPFGASTPPESFRH